MRGNRELNDELQEKARELEELFAVHKLAAASSRRGRGKEKAAIEYSSDDSPDQKTSVRGSSSNRGEFYESYVRLREAKLREDWESKRAEKEAEMKGLRRRLDESQAELKLRSLSIGPSLARQEQIAESLKNEEDRQEMYQKFATVGRESYSGPLLGGSYSKASKSKNVPAFTDRIRATPISQSPNKPATSVSTRQRSHPESRKENTRPTTAISKVAQSRYLARSKSIDEEIKLSKEGNHQRSQSLVKNLASSSQNDLSSLNSEKSNIKPLAPSKLKNGEPKLFLKKGNGIGPGAGAVVSKLRASAAVENLQNGEDSKDMLKDRNKELRKATSQVFLKADDCYIESDNEKPRLSQESSSAGDHVLDNGHIATSLASFSPSTSAIAGSQVSDTDASMDHRIGDLGQLNPNQPNEPIQSDAARTRKKWGSPHKPVIGTKGFKRFLSFGRKNKNTESPVSDSVSLSTSCEFDSQDLSKPWFDDSSDSNSVRSLPPYDGIFKDGKIFPDEAQSSCSSIPASPADHRALNSPKASRSFLSFSKSKNKGSESRLRGT